MLDLVLHLGLAIEQLFHFVGVGHFAELFGELLVLGEQRPRRGDGFFDVAEDVLVRVELRLLRQQADREAFGELGLAVEVLVDAGHDPQQRALAGAIAAQHADLQANHDSSSCSSFSCILFDHDNGHIVGAVNSLRENPLRKHPK